MDSVPPDLPDDMPPLEPLHPAIQYQVVPVVVIAFRE